MRVPEIVTVSDARTRLSRILAELSEAGSDAEPVLIGAHRKPQGVLLSLEAFETLAGRASRNAAVNAATASLAAEGLRVSQAAESDASAYVRGDLSADEMVARAVNRHRNDASDPAAG